MPYNPNTFIPTRYGRTFQVLNQNPRISPMYFMAAATTGCAGDVLAYGVEDTVAPAVSGALRHQIAGFLLQDVKDLDAGAVRGWRNLNNTVANLGDNIGILQSNELCETKRYTGSPAVKDRLCVDSVGQLRTYGSSSLETGDPIAVVESTVSSVPVATEPQQKSTSGGPNFIRIKVYNL